MTNEQINRAVAEELGAAPCSATVINRFWRAWKHGPRNYTAKRDDGETRLYFSREALERDFGRVAFAGESPNS